MRLLAAVLVLFAPISAGADEPTGKLPTGIAPTHYALSLKVDPRAARFSGTAKIRIRLDRAADHLWLHGRKLTLTDSALIDAAGKRHKLATVMHAESGLIEVRFGATLPAQDAELVIEFNAPFNPESEGLFVTKVGKESYAVTQMEAITARYVFPGFDEPRFKTPFDIVLTVPSADTAFANTQAVGEAASADGTWKTVTYATTKPLPTYLIALAVGPWDVVAGPTLAANDVRLNPLPLRVMGPRGTGPQLHWIVEQMAGVVEYLERYTGQPYAFDKLDLLGVPGFSASAMENAGLIIFDDVLLRLDAHSPASAYVEGFVVAAHEVSHQWFGDLVTMPWWDGLWLNESFANWAQARVTTALKPEYLGDLASVSDALSAMGSDSLLSARRIRQPIVSQDDIENAFDDITYLKGAALLRMMEGWLGEETYRDALREYLAGRAFGSGSTDDLIATLQKVSGNREISGVMHSFLDRAGVPLIRSELRCHDGQGTLALSQARYLPYGTSPAQEASSWQVPVCMRFGRGVAADRQCFALTQARQEFPVAGGCADWYAPNAGADGYYRTSMEARDFAALGAHFANLRPSEQMTYADALASGFRHGELAPTVVLDRMPALAGSEYPQVASALFSWFKWIREYLADAKTRPALDAFAATLYGPRMQTLGFRHDPNDTFAVRASRAQIAEFLALTIRDAGVRKALAGQGRAALGLDGGGADLARADTDLRALALEVAVQDLGRPAFDAVLGELKTNRETQQRNELLNALGSTLDAGLGERARTFALGTDLQVVEMKNVFSAQTDQSENRRAFWHWFKAHFEPIRARLPDEGGIVGIAASGWCSDAEAQELSAWFGPRAKQLLGAERTLAQAEEAIQQCSALRAHAGDEDLAEWAAAHAFK
jgi:cytosol alanyl aminopeptidase